MMDGYDMNGWGWFGMTIMVIVTVAVVGLNATRGSREAKSTRTNTTNALTPCAGRTRSSPLILRDSDIRVLVDDPTAPG